MEQLSEMDFVAIGDHEPAAKKDEISGWLEQLPEWQVLERDGASQLERGFEFEDFAQALGFTNRVGRLAEEKNHHPTLVTEWGKVTVTWWTHSVGGLHRNDFVMAAKTDELYEEQI
ncbi:MAG: 4a-hydroxytetrahydrobiopterin dehydratase [Anaerolineae bacterium]|jgi:4a-hydroxytetrahydrobiopterin dehydratase